MCVTVCAYACVVCVACMRGSVGARGWRGGKERERVSGSLCVSEKGKGWARSCVVIQRMSEKGNAAPMLV